MPEPIVERTDCCNTAYCLNESFTGVAKALGIIYESAFALPKPLKPQKSSVTTSQIIVSTYSGIGKTSFC